MCVICLVVMVFVVLLAFSVLFIHSCGIYWLLSYLQSFIGAVRSPPNSWATGHFEIALDFYQVLPTKPSGKPAYRLQTSKVGTLVL